MNNGSPSSEAPMSHPWVSNSWQDCWSQTHNSNPSRCGEETTIVHPLLCTHWSYKPSAGFSLFQSGHTPRVDTSSNRSLSLVLSFACENRFRINKHIHDLSLVVKQKSIVLKYFLKVFVSTSNCIKILEVITLELLNFKSNISTCYKVPMCSTSKFEFYCLPSAEAILKVTFTIYKVNFCYRQIILTEERYYKRYFRQWTVKARDLYHKEFSFQMLKCNPCKTFYRMTFQKRCEAK